jgi:hypothetical protein
LIDYSHTALWLAYAQHGFDGVAEFGIGDGTIDLAEVIVLK